MKILFKFCPFLFVLAVAAQNVLPPKSVILKAARILDVRTGSYLTGQAILIEGDKIKEVGVLGVIQSHAPKDVQIIDLGASTLLPGLIDSHTHLLQNYDAKLGGDDLNMIATVSQMSPAARALLGAKMGREDLMSGITTVRDVGNSGLNGDIALRDAIRQGWVEGPRILASTRALSAAGGQFGHLQSAAQNLVEQEYAVVATPDDARRAVQQAFYDGADCIKVIVNTGSRVVSLDTMKAIVDEAHRVHKKVAAHAIGDIATRNAADAGVDSIEHAYTVPDDVLKTMAARKIYLVPTDGSREVFTTMLAAMAPGEDAAKTANSLIERSGARLRRAIAAGVPIAAGSDMYYNIPGMTRGQASLDMLRAYSEEGVALPDIIRAATINAADLLGMADRIGTLEPGKLADIIAVPGDPLREIAPLLNATFVMKGGTIVKNTTH